MANIGFPCGNTISDSSDNLPYKAWFTRSQDRGVLDMSIADIVSFMEAYKNGKKEEWIKDKFGDSVNPRIPNDWLIIKIQLFHEFEYEDLIYQCQECDRILIDTSDHNKMASFMPESDNCKGIFEGKKQWE